MEKFATKNLNFEKKIKYTKLKSKPTPIPNELLENLAEISGNELKVLLFILRKTIGFQKQGDYISYSQIMKATGLTKSTIIRAIRKLAAKEYIEYIKDEEKQLNYFIVLCSGKITYNEEHDGSYSGYESHPYLPEISENTPSKAPLKNFTKGYKNYTGGVQNLNPQINKNKNSNNKEKVFQTCNQNQQSKVDFQKSENINLDDILENSPEEGLKNNKKAAPIGGSYINLYNSLDKDGNMLNPSLGKYINLVKNNNFKIVRYTDIKHSLDLLDANCFFLGDEKDGSGKCFTEELNVSFSDIIKIAKTLDKVTLMSLEESFLENDFNKIVNMTEVNKFLTKVYDFSNLNKDLEYTITHFIAKKFYIEKYIVTSEKLRNHSAKTFYLNLLMNGEWIFEDIEKIRKAYYRNLELIKIMEWREKQKLEKQERIVKSGNKEESPKKPKIKKSKKFWGNKKSNSNTVKQQYQIDPSKIWWDEDIDSMQISGCTNKKSKKRPKK